MKTTNKTKKPAKRIVKLKVKSGDEIIANHAWSTPKYNHFNEEIYQKTDKFFNRILTVGYIICAICAIILVIVNIK